MPRVVVVWAWVGRYDLIPACLPKKISRARRAQYTQPSPAPTHLCQGPYDLQFRSVCGLFKGSLGVLVVVELMSFTEPTKVVKSRDDSSNFSRLWPP